MQATTLGGAKQAVAPRPLGSSDYKTLGLAALGGALEFYDFIIFVFFAPAIGQLFFPQAIPDWLRQLQTFGIFAAGYLARPLGGIIMAHFGDLLGRKRMFTLSVLLMSVPTEWYESWIFWTVAGGAVLAAAGTTIGIVLGVEGTRRNSNDFPGFEIQLQAR